jgi:hypothetical protein
MVWSSSDVTQQGSRPKTKLGLAIQKITHKEKEMRKLFIGTAISLALTSSVFAGDYLHGSPGTYQQYGNTTYGPGGSTYQQYGNTTYGSDGSTYQRYGNTTYNSDGSSSQQYGNTLYNSDGTTVQRYGNTTYGSDGTTCQKYNNTTYCN